MCVSYVGELPFKRPHRISLWVFVKEMANEIVFVFPASRFMAYHTTLKNSQEFTAALLRARELAENITISMRKIPGTSPDFEVFPYT